MSTLPLLRGIRMHLPGTLFSILIAECAGLLGVFFTLHAIPEWYVFLNKPSFSPPNWIFGPMWTLLYALMGIAAYRVWRHASSPSRTYAIRAYAIQLVLNALWTPVFFGLRNPMLGLVVIALLLVMIMVTIFRFGKIDRIATALLAPYLAWVCFASALNLFIVILN